MEQIRSNLLQILAEESGVPSDRILDTNQLQKNLGIGGAVGNPKIPDLVKRIETRFAIRIPISDPIHSDKATEITVGEIVASLSRLICSRS